VRGFALVVLEIETQRSTHSLNQSPKPLCD
jgi:hypothetical protein